MRLCILYLAALGTAAAVSCEREGGRIGADVERSVVSALASDNVLVLERALPDDASISDITIEGRPLVHLAVEAGAPAALRFLIAQGADADARDAEGAPVLIVAAQEGDPECVRLLLEAGADPNEEWKLPGRLHVAQAPVHLAVSRGESATQVVELLLEAGARIDARDSRDRTALDWAAIHGREDVLQTLLDAGADPSGGPRSDPLTFIVQWAHPDGDPARAARMIRLLVRAGAAVDSPTADMPALANAVLLGEPEMVATLLEAGADPSRPTQYYDSVLDLAREGVDFGEQAEARQRIVELLEDAVRTANEDP